MRYSLFRFRDVIEAFAIYFMCFGLNLFLVYIQSSTMEVASLLEAFIDGIVEYRILISIFLTFMMAVFHYQFLNRKKTEIACRILVGDTREYVITRYIVNSLTILLFSFVIALVVGVYLDVAATSNLYLLFLFMGYLFISVRQVKHE